MADEDLANVFAFPDFNLSSKWLTLSSGLDSQFFDANLDDSGKPNEGHIGAKPPTADLDGFFKLPDSLVPINLAEADEIGHQDTSTLETIHDVDLHDLDVFDDSWLHEELPVAPKVEYKTWDAFLIPDGTQAQPLFITEAGPGAYDAAIKNEADVFDMQNAENPTVQTAPYLAALLALVLGRGSVFFTWDEEKVSFVPDVDGMRISGYSSEVLKGIQRRCMECGNTTRSLSAYVQITYKQHPSAISIAIAKAIDLTLATIQRILGSRARNARSILQLQTLIQPVRSVLAYFKSLIVKVSKLRSDEQILSLIFKEAQALEHGEALLGGVIREILSRVSQPWTQFAERWIGVKAEGGVPLTKEDPGNSFVKVDNISLMDDSGVESAELDYVLDENRMPDFVPSETALVMFETGKTLRLLRTHHPDHPLCHMDLIMSSEPPTLQWHFDWKSIGCLQNDVKNYEERLTKNLQEWPRRRGLVTQITSPVEKSCDENYGLHFFGHEGVHLEDRLVASIEALNKPPFLTSEEDSLSKLLYARLSGDTAHTEEAHSNFSPHWSLIPYHSFGPLVAAQARVINREYMKLLFTTHHLREHLSLQKQFHLLGNGVFCSRFSHALFDPNLDTAERQAGVALSGGVMGLRLSGRDNWPPASSELRLALMGVLAESYLPPSSEANLPANKERKHDLPGDISFGVRDLSAEEIDKCLDANSLEALDFLRLSYKPPAPLSPVFTPVVLLKYDKIFKLLLRVLRMLYVSEQLFQDSIGRSSNWHDIDNASLRFRFEAQHFISSISAYFFDTGIEVPWRRFETWLGGVQDSLTTSEHGSEGARILSPDELREEHERVLDHMMHTLLLRKRQQPILKLLEDIFAVILKFSKVSRVEALGRGKGKTQTSSSRTLYTAFKKKVDVFITVCRALLEKSGHTGKPMRDDGGEGRGEGVKEGSSIDKLLIKLEMSGYYGYMKT
ncbi:Spc97/Spc98 family protein [Hypoxylon fragiforme]|uniref:Spc97/Spc98 family protein n=1 Tax=Hypoxylon fragiforme TaxID=63214 RepID=UPI0020C67388|nr:Spc97/Spc98 family protein [Hypoxylon fragiforme]KAI2607332.1 Spc97/Spc98 family protein [Hypoxylon fragiforme]